LLIGSQDIQPKLRAIENSRKTKNPELKQSLRNRVKMLDAATTRPIDPNAVAYIREFKIVFTVKIPLKDKKGLPLGDDMKRGNELKLSFEQTLKSAGLRLVPMDAESYLRHIGQMPHWKPSADWRGGEPCYDETLPINGQISEHDDRIEVNKNSVLLGDKWLRILSPAVCPKQ
jgi:conjugal transfer ATP-binding protein TraC